MTTYETLRDAKQTLDICGIKSEIKGAELHISCSENKLRDNGHALVGSGIAIFKPSRGKFIAVVMK